MDIIRQSRQTILNTTKEMLFLLLHPRMTHCLVGINVAIYIMQLFLAIERFLSFDTSQGQWWGIITASFLHEALWHITANMLGLMIYGPLVERVLRRSRFLSFYLICNLVAMFVVSFRGGGYGASGALAGVIGASLVFAWIWRKQSDASLGFFVLALVGSILFLFSGTIMKCAFGIGVADDAHVAGYVFGLVVAIVLWRQNLLPTSSPFINIQQANSLRHP